MKAEHQVPYGLLNPIPVPQWKWDNIAMDFVPSLPLMQKKHDSVWVIFDRLMKSVAPPYRPNQEAEPDPGTRTSFTKYTFSNTVEIYVA